MDVRPRSMESMSGETSSEDSVQRSEPRRVPGGDGDGERGLGGWEV